MLFTLADNFIVLSNKTTLRIHKIVTQFFFLH